MFNMHEIDDKISEGMPLWPIINATAAKYV